MDGRLDKKTWSSTMVQSIAVLSAYIAVRTGVGACSSIVHSSALAHSIGVTYSKKY